MNLQPKARWRYAVSGSLTSAWTEGKVLVDPGRSAWNPAVKRPAWDELMDRLERGVSGGMIVFDLERFTRQPKDGERMIELAAAGLMVLDSESEYDLTTPNGKKAFRDAHQRRRLLLRPAVNQDQPRQEAQGDGGRAERLTSGRSASRPIS